MSQSNFDRLQAAGAITGGADAATLRPVFDGLSSAEVDLLLTINEKVSGALPEVEEHTVIGAGIF